MILFLPFCRGPCLSHRSSHLLWWQPVSLKCSQCVPRGKWPILRNLGGISFFSIWEEPWYSQKSPQELGPGSDFPTYRLCYWTSYLTSLGLSFLVCKIRIVIPNFFCLMRSILCHSHIYRSFLHSFTGYLFTAYLLSRQHWQKGIAGRRNRAGCRSGKCTLLQSVWPGSFHLEKPDKMRRDCKHLGGKRVGPCEQGRGFSKFLWETLSVWQSWIMKEPDLGWLPKTSPLRPPACFLP